MTTIKKRKAILPIIDVKKYGGLQVAIVDRKIIATGRTLESVIKNARKKAPSRPLNEIGIFSVPKSLYVIYRA
jgi:hypothetical protein